MPSPTIGRIVLYQAGKATYPAIVTATYPDLTNVYPDDRGDTVDLVVFGMEGEVVANDEGYFPLSGPATPARMVRHDDEQALISQERPPQSGKWHWPPRP